MEPRIFFMPPVVVYGHIALVPDGKDLAMIKRGDHHRLKRIGIAAIGISAGNDLKQCVRLIERAMVVPDHFSPHRVIVAQQSGSVDAHQGKRSARMAGIGTDHCTVLHVLGHVSRQPAINHVHIRITDKVELIERLMAAPEMI